MMNRWITTTTSIANDLEQNLIPSTSLSYHISKKRKEYFYIHGLVFVFICCLAAAGGVATFFGQRALELAVFKTAFDGTIQQLPNTVQIGLSQKFAASRLLNKLYTFSVENGCGTTKGQSPPFFTLPGLQNYSLEFKTLGGSLRGVEWHPFVDNNTRPAWESWAKQNIASQTVGSPGFFKTINATGE